MKEAKAWGIVDVSERKTRLFYGVKGDFHVFKTKKEAQKYIDEQFFNAKDMGWRTRRLKISL